MEATEMNGALSLSAMPIWKSALLVVGLGVALSMVGPVLIRRFWRLDQLKANNEVGSFKFAVIGGVYAVVLGFATVVVWEKFRDAESAVMQEAAAISSLDRLVNTLDKPSAQRIRARLQAYDRAAIEDEWPAMSRGGASPLVSKALDELYAAVLAQNQQGSRESAILQAQLTQLNGLTQARRERLDLASGIVPGVVWLVLISGAVVTMTFTLFFGASSLLAQAVMNGLLSFLIFMTLLVIQEINFPFSGSLKVTPEPLAALVGLWRD
jgi:hypothetical protein